MRPLFTIVLWLLAVLGIQAQTSTVLLASMNCYWFLGQEESKAADKLKPRTSQTARSSPLTLRVRPSGVFPASALAEWEWDPIPA